MKIFFSDIEKNGEISYSSPLHHYIWLDKIELENKNANILILMRIFRNWKDKKKLNFLKPELIDFLIFILTN